MAPRVLASANGPRTTGSAALVISRTVGAVLEDRRKGRRTIEPWARIHEVVVRADGAEPETFSRARDRDDPVERQRLVVPADLRKMSTEFHRQECSGRLTLAYETPRADHGSWDARYPVAHPDGVFLIH